MTFRTVVVACIALAACGGSGAPSVTPTPVQTSSPAPQPVVRQPARSTAGTAGSQSAVSGPAANHPPFPLVIHATDLRTGLHKTMDVASALSNVLSVSSAASGATSLLAEQVTAFAINFLTAPASGPPGAPAPAFAVEAPPLAKRRVIDAASMQQGNRLSLDDSPAGASSLELMGHYSCDAGVAPYPVGAAIGEESGQTRLVVGGQGRLCLFDLGNPKPFHDAKVQAKRSKNAWVPQVACNEFCRAMSAMVDSTNYVTFSSGDVSSVPRHSETRESSDKLFGHRLPIPSVPLGVDYIASPSEDGTVLIWHPSDETMRPKKIDGAGAITAATFARHQDLLAIAEQTTQSVSVWDVTDAGRLVAVFYGHAGRITAIALEADGKHLATAGDDGLVRIWNITTRQLERTLRASPTSMGFIKGGLFVTAGRTLDVWDVENGRYVAAVGGSSDFCPKLAASPDEDYIACSVGSQVSVYKLAREMTAAAAAAESSTPAAMAGVFAVRLIGCNPGAGGLRCSFSVKNTSSKEEGYRANDIVGYADGVKVKSPTDRYRPELYDSGNGKCGPGQTCTMIFIFEAPKVTRITFDVDLAVVRYKLVHWPKQGSLAFDVP